MAKLEDPIDAVEINLDAKPQSRERPAKDGPESKTVGKPKKAEAKPKAIGRDQTSPEGRALNAVLESHSITPFPRFALEPWQSWLAANAMKIDTAHAHALQNALNIARTYVAPVSADDEIEGD